MALQLLLPNSGRLQQDADTAMKQASFPAPAIFLANGFIFAGLPWLRCGRLHRGTRLFVQDFVGHHACVALITLRDLGSVVSSSVDSSYSVNVLPAGLGAAGDHTVVLRASDFTRLTAVHTLGSRKSTSIMLIYGCCLRTVSLEQRSQPA